MIPFVSFGAELRSRRRREPGASAGGRILRRCRRAAIAVVAICLLMAVGELALSEAFPFPTEQIAALPRSRQIHAADGTLLCVTRTPAAERVLPVPLAEIPACLRQALLVAQDRRFFAHRGVDAPAVAREVLGELRLGRPSSRRASTITMQVVDILSGPRPRSIAAGVRRMFRARQLERILSKQRILQIYCNHVPLGDRVRGFEAAARRWFGCSAAALDPVRAATLVAMIPDPEGLLPSLQPARLQARRDRLLARLRDRGVLSDREYRDGVARPLDAWPRPWAELSPHVEDCLAGGSDRPVVRTGLLPRLQRRLEIEVSRVHTGPAQGLAIVVLGRACGGVRALVGTGPGAGNPLMTSHPLAPAVAPLLTGGAAASPLQAARACRGEGATVRRSLRALPRFPIGGAGRVGTVAFASGASADRRDAWCIGITRDHILVVWTGDPTGGGVPGLAGGRTALRLMTRVAAMLDPVRTG